MIAHAQGNTAREKAALDEMIRRDGDDAPGMVAETFAFEGNLEQAFAWFDRAFEARDTTIMSIYEAPPEILGPLRKDPRFAAFCKKVGLPTPAEVVASRSVGQ